MIDLLFVAAAGAAPGAALVMGVVVVVGVVVGVFVVILFVFVVPMVCLGIDFTLLFNSLLVACLLYTSPRPRDS